MRKMRLSPWTSVFLGNHNLSPKTRALWDRWTDRFPVMPSRGCAHPAGLGRRTDGSTTPSTCAPCVQMEIRVTRPVRLFHFNVFKSFLFYRGRWKGWKAPRREEVGETQGRAVALLQELCTEVSAMACKTGWAGHSCVPVNHSLPFLILFFFFFTLLSTFLVQYIYHKGHPQVVLMVKNLLAGDAENTDSIPVSGTSPG